MTEHPNNMSAWDEIRCQRGHDTHTTRRVTVDLSVPHQYHNHAPISAALAPAPYDMFIYEPDLYPVDGNSLGYCPAHDAVSETIAALGVWEPDATVLALTVLRGAPEDSMMLDLGCQLGWFSFLAMSCGVYAWAWDADATNLEVFNQTVAANEGWRYLRSVRHARIDAATAPLSPEPFRFVKVDIEGAEPDAVRTLWPAIEAGLVDHMLVEVSPTFIPGDTYPDLVTRIIDAGFRAYVFPEPSLPPVALLDPEADMVRVDLRPDLRKFIRDCVQTDCWFRREEAAW